MRTNTMSVALLLAIARDLAVIVFVVAYVIHIW
jgi:hypothetical protein